MATSNRRVAAYFPTEIDEAFTAYKIENGFATEGEPTANDSKALIEIVKQFLNVEYQVAHSVPLPDNLVTQEQVDDLRKEFNSRLSELLGESLKLSERVEVLEKSSTGEGLLTVGELAKRLGIASSTLSHWKSSGSKGKTPEQLLKVTREKDPQGIGWILIEPVNKFKPEQTLSSDSPSSSQGNLSVS
jgi:intein/homing endonuclease